jgi:hypothetical protein
MAQKNQEEGEPGQGKKNESIASEQSKNGQMKN